MSIRFYNPETDREVTVECAEGDSVAITLAHRASDPHGEVSAKLKTTIYVDRIR